MTEKLQHTLQHHCNSMHVYCRLCDFVPRSAAIKISRAWERVVHPIIYSGSTAWQASEDPDRSPAAD